MHIFTAKYSLVDTLQITAEIFWNLVADLRYGGWKGRGLATSGPAYKNLQPPGGKSLLWVISVTSGLAISAKKFMEPRTLRHVHFMYIL